MNKITEVTRRDLFDIIQEGFDKETDNTKYVLDGIRSESSFEVVHIYMPFCGRYSPIDFLDRIYHLEELPSTDRRFKNAKGDIYCHTVSFDDWPKFWFLDDDRFELKDGFEDEPLLKFLCEMLHPAVREETEPWEEYLEQFNKLLRRDGYEIYSAYHISGKEIYKVREYTKQAELLLPGKLFSERYKGLIQYGNGEPVDNISGDISYSAKKHICKNMFDFAEPMRIQRSRYDHWTDETDALKESIRRLNEFMGIPVVDITGAFFSPCPPEELLANFFTPFIFDVIEFQFDELSNGEKEPFRTAINTSFQKVNVPFRLTDSGLIEPVVNYEVLSPAIISEIDSVAEPGIRELLNEAIEKHMQPSFQSHRDAVEKIWDALERLKTYYVDRDKKASVSKIICDMAGGETAFETVFHDEFTALTKIGNDFRIRHHETNKIDISDIRHYDYFFNRCLALITTVLQYLQ